MQGMFIGLLKLNVYGDGIRVITRRGGGGGGNAAKYTHHDTGASAKPRGPFAICGAVPGNASGGVLEQTVADELAAVAHSSRAAGGVQSVA
jgi:hypothetical protein